MMASWSRVVVATLLLGASLSAQKSRCDGDERLWFVVPAKNFKGN